MLTFKQFRGTRKKYAKKAPVVRYQQTNQYQYTMHNRFGAIVGRMTMKPDGIHSNYKGSNHVNPTERGAKNYVSRRINKEGPQAR